MKNSTRNHFFWLIGIVLVGLAAYASWGFASVYWTPEKTAPAPSVDESTDTTATADNVDDFGACNEEAKLYCSGFYSDDWEAWADENGYTSASWKLGLVDCLAQNEEQLSQTCIDSLDRRQELNENMNEACAVDRTLYCRYVKPAPGAEPQVDCLKENYDSLSAACVEALDAHEAAKPLESN